MLRTTTQLESGTFSESPDGKVSIRPRKVSEEAHQPCTQMPLHAKQDTTHARSSGRISFRSSNLHSSTSPSSGLTQYRASSCTYQSHHFLEPARFSLSHAVAEENEPIGIVAPNAHARALRLQAQDNAVIRELAACTLALRPRHLDHMFLHRRRTRGQGRKTSQQWYVRLDDWLAGTAANTQAAPAFFDIQVNGPSLPMCGI